MGKLFPHIFPFSTNENPRKKNRIQNYNEICCNSNNGFTNLNAHGANVIIKSVLSELHVIHKQLTNHVSCLMYTCHNAMPEINSLTLQLQLLFSRYVKHLSTCSLISRHLIKCLILLLREMNYEILSICLQPFSNVQQQSI